MHACAHVCVRQYVYACRCASVCVCTRVVVRARVCVYVYVYLCASFAHTHLTAYLPVEEHLREFDAGLYPVVARKCSRLLLECKSEREAIIIGNVLHCRLEIVTSADVADKRQPQASV